MRVQTDDPVAVCERVRDGTAHLAVFHENALVAEVTRAVDDLPNDDPAPGAIYTVDLVGGRPGTFAFAPGLTADYRTADPVRTDLVDAVDVVRTYRGEGLYEGPSTDHALRVEFRLDHLVGRHDYACHLFCKSNGATTRAVRAASGYHLDVTGVARVRFPLADRIADLTAGRTFAPDRGLLADVAVLLLKAPARGVRVDGTPFDPTWAPPRSSQHDVVRVDRVLLDPHWGAEEEGAEHRNEPARSDGGRVSRWADLGAAAREEFADG